MAMIDDSAVREHLAKLLAWEDAHVGFDKAVHGIPPALRGKRPSKLPYSPWQLVEHLRITQRDILEFCRNPEYQELKWPDDYWPAAAGPASSRKWAESIGQFRSIGNCSSSSRAIAQSNWWLVFRTGAARRSFERFCWRQTTRLITSLSSSSFDGFSASGKS